MNLNLSVNHNGLSEAAAADREANLDPAYSGGAFVLGTDANGVQYSITFNVTPAAQ